VSSFFSYYLPKSTVPEIRKVKFETSAIGLPVIHTFIFHLCVVELMVSEAGGKNTRTFVGLLLNTYPISDDLQRTFPGLLCRQLTFSLHQAAAEAPVLGLDARSTSRATVAHLLLRGSSIMVCCTALGLARNAITCSVCAQVILFLYFRVVIFVPTAFAICTRPVTLPAHVTVFPMKIPPPYDFIPQRKSRM